LSEISEFAFGLQTGTALKSSSTNWPFWLEPFAFFRSEPISWQLITHTLRASSNNLILKSKTLSLCMPLEPLSFSDNFLPKYAILTKLPTLNILTNSKSKVRIQVKAKIGKFK
jgi:hypothetical protein